MNCKIDKAMEHEHWEQWGRIRQYEREHPIRDMLEWIVTMLIASVLGVVSGVLLGVVALCTLMGILTPVLTILVDFGVL